MALKSSAVRPALPSRPVVFLGVYVLQGARSTVIRCSSYFHSMSQTGRQLAAGQQVCLICNGATGPVRVSGYIVDTNETGQCIAVPSIIYGVRADETALSSGEARFVVLCVPSSDIVPHTETAPWSTAVRFPEGSDWIEMRKVCYPAFQNQHGMQRLTQGKN